MKNGIYLILTVNCLLLASCSSLKETIYFQNKKTIPKPSISIPPHIIAVGDILSLNINTPLQTSTQILNMKDGSNFQVKGDSTIEIPVIGVIKIAGLSMALAKDSLLQRSKVYFNEPYVNIQLLSFKVTVLGEVPIAGIKAMVSENSTLLDALASSGDLTNFGNRTNIKVLRGKEVFYLDITSIDVFNSSGFYLQSNDIIYVEPLRKKNVLSNLSTFLAVTSFVSIVTTLTTTIILLTK